METQRLQRFHQAGLFQVGRYHARTGSQTGLDPGLDPQAACDCLLGENTGAEHDRRIRGVGTAGDRRDHNRTMPDPAGDTVDLDRYRGFREPVDATGCGGGVIGGGGGDLVILHHGQ